MYKRALILSLLALPFWLNAQTADDYFHGGATNFVFGEKEKAVEQVVAGLQNFPSDPKLNGLIALLKKEEEQKQPEKQQEKNDQNKDQKQNQDSKQKNSDEKKDSEQKNQQSDEQKKQEEKKKQQEQAGKKSEQKKDQESADRKKEKPDQKEQEEPAQPVAAGQMTPQQAKQLLDAQKGDEMIMPIRPEGKPRDTSKPFKDW